MGKHDGSRSSSRSLSRNQIECKSDIRKRKNSSTSSYKERKRRKCSPSPSRSGSKITTGTHDKSRKYSSELHSSSVSTKKYYKRETSSTSTNTSRSNSDSDSSHKKCHKRKHKKHAKKDSSSSEASSSSESESSCSSSSTVAKRKHRKEKKRRKDKKRRKKEKNAKRKLKRKKDRLSIGPEIKPIEVETPTASCNRGRPIEDTLLTDRAKAMAPMTKEEWEKRQSVIRRVFDEETGRHRLIKGDGEVLEEIVSRDRHREINRQATKGDGDFFQATLAAKQFK